ncbi:hypothetical protein E4U57_001377 [Claviceps arundinis]|uniref:Threonine/serine exporter-like N-terminal domain-containing protein n=1 Tax=Claviceps arundinis TaxID=1623583 RepID=A0A9P7MZC7_9HYPO|nr:hypothetical protein E4U57_001377 [Claviceps arundinis]KAG5976118.1 hypothetical protein E4U56_002460 [Claviceps arundinis]
MDHRRVDSLALSAWSADDSRRNSEDEDVHRVMDDASDHDDHVTQDAHIASEQQHHSRFESDGVRYRASHSRPHPSSPPMPSTPVVSPRASPPASESRVSGGLVVVPSTVHMSSISARRKYLVKLSRAIIIYGAPTHRLEEYMSMSLRALEIEGEFSYIPNCMTISFDESTADAAQVKLVRVLEGIDLGRLQDVHDISMDVAHDRLGVKEAARRLDEVLGKSPKFKVWFRILIYGLASACVAPFGFEGRFIDLPIAFILGCIVGLMQLVFAAKYGHAYVFDFFAAVVTSFLARGFGSINDGQLFCFSTLAQSSIVMCLPGYVVLCGSLELQGDKIVAGSTRMVHAMGYILRLGCGIPLGAALYGMMDSNATSEAHCNNPLAREWCFLFVPGFTICLCINLQAKWRQIPAMLATAMAGFCAVSYSTEYLTNHFSPNAQIPTMLGALTVAILASLYSRLSERVQSLWPDFVDFWRCRVQPRLLRRPQADAWPLPSPSDPEANAVPPPGRPPRKVRHSLAAATSLPGLLVLVPAGLVATGSLLAGIHVTAGAVNATTFYLGLSLLQVAFGLTIGLSIGALILYPLGKRRSGLTSF